MEGRYGVYRSDEPVETHTHVIFHFTDGTELRYKDVRQFGTMDLFAPGEEWVLPPLNKLGLEPLSDTFTLQALRDWSIGDLTKKKTSDLAGGHLHSGESTGYATDPHLQSESIDVISA